MSVLKEISERIVRQKAGSPAVKLNAQRGEGMGTL